MSWINIELKQQQQRMKNESDAVSIEYISKIVKCLGRRQRERERNKSPARNTLTYEMC